LNSTLGLAPTSVQVSPYSGDWQQTFEAERDMLARNLGRLAIDIQHVGSTAVPGLSAKPIIDIAIAITDESLAGRVSAVLKGLGYRFAVDAGHEGGLIFYRETEPPLRTHHVHVVTIDDSQWRNYLRFRDLLRTDASLRSEYAALKEKLARRFATDRQGYTEAKTEFVRSALARQRGAGS